MAKDILTGSIILPIALGVASIILGVVFLHRLHRFGLWLTLGLVGQAVSLQLIDAGKSMHYQHYLPVNGQLLKTYPFLLAFLVFQTFLVGIGLWRRHAKIVKWAHHNFKIWQILGIGLVFGLFSATVSHAISIYLSELVFATFIQTINLGNLVLILWSLPEEVLVSWKIRIDKFFGPNDEDNKRVRVDQFAIVAALWVVILAAALNVFAYQRQPHIPDEVVYIYQARFLADGKLTMPAPPVKDAFDVYLMEFDGAKWYPSPPFGWPIILAVGVLFGVPWLVNPILGGINIILTYLFLQELYSRRLARISLILLCLSPWYVFMGMNFMTHMFTLTCALVAIMGVIWTRKSGKVRWVWLAGAALGVMSLIRPLEGLTMAVLVGLWAIGIGGRRLKIAAIIALVLGTGLVAGIVLPYNKYLTGKATEFPINLYTDERFGKNSNAYGFGPDRGMGWPIDPNPGHSPVDGMINADLNTFSINVELFGWGIGSLLLIGLFVFSGKYKTSDFLMMAAIVGIFIVFFFYYFSGGPDFGARYWFLMIVPLVALSVRGIQYLFDKFETGLNPSSTAGTRVLIGVLLLCAFTLVNYFPWRAIDKYFHYLNMRPDIRELAKKENFGNSIVFIRGDSNPDYASAAVYNPVDVYADAPIYVWDRNQSVRDEVVKAYPNRPIWVIDGPSVTKKGYQIDAGPLTAIEFLSK